MVRTQEKAAIVVINPSICTASLINSFRQPKMFCQSMDLTLDICCICYSLRKKKN